MEGARETRDVVARPLWPNAFNLTPFMVRELTLMLKVGTSMSQMERFALHSYIRRLEDLLDQNEYSVINDWRKQVYGK